MSRSAVLKEMSYLPFKELDVNDRKVLVLRGLVAGIHKADNYFYFGEKPSGKSYYGLSDYLWIISIPSKKFTNSKLKSVYNEMVELVSETHGQPYAAFAASYCPYCGTKVDQSYSFCPSCGKSLKDVPSGDTQSGSNYIPGFLHDLNGLRQVINTLTSTAVRNTGANGKVVFSESSFPLKFAFDLRDNNCLEKNLDSKWMQSDAATKWDSAVNYWYYYPVSMTYDREKGKNNNSRLWYNHRPNPYPTDEWVTKMTYSEDLPSKREIIMIISADQNRKLKIVIGDTDIDLTIEYFFDGKGNVLLYSKIPPKRKPYI